jgi:hypothetical protein
MCYLVTIGTSGSRAAVATLLGPDLRLGVQPSTNPSLQSLFPPGDQLFQVTSGGCSCDLVIQANELSRDGQRERLRSKYTRKGWSVAKIGRALADWEVAHERRSQLQGAPRAELCALLRAIASESGSVRVFVHFYSGAFDSEQVTSDERIRMSVDRLVDVSVIGEDRLVEISAPAG